MNAPEQQRSVFLDLENKRWFKIRNSALMVAGAFLLLMGALVVGILSNPSLSLVELPDIGKVGFHPPTMTKTRTNTLRNNKDYQKIRTTLMRNVERVSKKSEGTTQASSSHALSGYESVGFFVNWDDTSLTSLKQNIAQLDVVVGEWLHLEQATGTLTVDNSAREGQAVDYIRSHNARTKIFALVNNFSNQAWLSKELTSILSSPADRARVSQQLVEYAKTRHYDGLSIDFENIEEGKQSLLTAFMEDLAPLAHAAGLKVTVNVPADDSGFEYAKLASLADGVIVMAYDEHWATGEPGPVASQSWFMNVVGQRMREIPPEKLIIAIGNYGYDWAPGMPAKELTFEDAVLTAKESEGDIGMEDVSMNPTFDYADEADRVHHVWMLDGVTAFNELASLVDVKPQGVALWRLGSEDPSIWKTFGTSTTFEARTAASLSTIDYGYDVDYEGQGEILKVSATPATGKRTIVFDPDQKLITTEEFVSFPLAYTIRRYGAQKKQIALTFDDGPDPAYTPAILDILKREKVPATFFVIGMNAEKSPELLERIFEEGHEIGSHTFTHPNLVDLSTREVELELAATQRLIEGLIHRQALLFRPPYAEDIEPETPDQTLTLETASRLGYLTVGMKLDPSDWQSVQANTITDRVVNQAESGLGNVVLLHDAGGDRSQTVAALPGLIEVLKQRGYTFVLVSDLVHKTRDEVMPPVAVKDQWQAVFGNISFIAISWLLLIVTLLGFVGIILGSFRSLFVSVLAIMQRWKGRARYVASEGDEPSVAVIVPAHNEERVIVRTVASLVAADHPKKFEIIVVDDGSTDATVARLEEAYGGHEQVRIFTKEGGGKSSALNAGMAQTEAEIVVCLDADTLFARECITKLIEPFKDARVGAVAGNAKVGNRINILTRLQALEYIVSQNLDRRAFSLLNCITVVPGAVGAWRRELVLRAGGFSHRTLAEDTDLTLTIRKMGYKIAYADGAIALTEAPDTIAGFIKQRFRWMYGTLQAAWINRDVLFRPRYGSLGFIALPSVILFQIIFPLVSPLMDLMLIVSLVWTGVDRYMHPLSFSSENLQRILLAFLVFTVLDAGSAVLAFFLERKEDWRLLGWIVWQRFCYRQLMYYVAILALVASLRGKAIGWNKVERKGTVLIKERVSSQKRKR